MKDLLFSLLLLSSPPLTFLLPSTDQSRFMHCSVYQTSSVIAEISCILDGHSWKGEGEHASRLTDDPHTSGTYLVAVLCGVIHPLPDVSLVFHRDGSHRGFGGRSCGHGKLNIHMTGKSGRHFPVRAQFKVAEETVRMARGYERQRMQCSGPLGGGT